MSRVTCLNDTCHLHKNYSPINAIDLTDSPSMSGKSPSHSSAETRVPAVSWAMLTLEESFSPAPCGPTGPPRMFFQKSRIRSFSSFEKPHHRLGHNKTRILSAPSRNRSPRQRGTTVDRIHSDKGSRNQHVRNPGRP